MDRIFSYPHDLQSPECWCHPLAMTPEGAYVRWKGTTVMIDRVPPVLDLYLNHQDALGAFLGMIPGGYIYINPELCKEPRMKLLFREFQGDMRN